jgi:hypothetical protein
VDPRACLDDMQVRKFLTLPGLKLRPLSHPARSQSLYRPRYPGSLYCGVVSVNCYHFLFHTNAEIQTVVFERSERG